MKPISYCIFDVRRRQCVLGYRRIDSPIVLNDNAAKSKPLPSLWEEGCTLNLYRNIFGNLLMALTVLFSAAAHVDSNPKKLPQVAAAMQQAQTIYAMPNDTPTGTISSDFLLFYGGVQAPEPLSVRRRRA